MMTTFLYVEDDGLSREIMKMMLTGLGYAHLTIFENSERFVERVMALDPVPDVVFLDIHVQPIDGFHMLRLLRDQPAFQNSSIIALTASVMNEEVALLRTAGFDGAIGKPLDFDQFPLLLTQILQRAAVWYVT